MSCDIGQYRASVGGFYCTMLCISTFRLNFVNMSNILPFFCLVYMQNRGISVSLFYIFILSNSEVKPKKETHHKTVFQIFDLPTKVNHDPKF